MAMRSGSGDGSVVLRAALAEDAEELARMRIALQVHLKLSNPHVWALEPRAAPVIARRYREILAGAGEPAMIPVAEARGQRGLVGMAMGRVMERHEFTPPVTGLVDDVWVEPAHRGRGLAKALLGEVVAFFGRHRVETVVLDYVVGNHEAERLWRGLGFTPVQVGADARLGDLAAALGRRRRV